jgi:hypothetical protein
MSKTKKAKLIPRSVKRAEDDAYIRQLYAKGQGLSMNQITQLGFSKSTVSRAIHQGRGKPKSNNKNHARSRK